MTAVARADASETSGASEVLALVGPTAAGKTAVALDVARRRHHTSVEIVAVDAFTIYRGMDIGTAKPTPEERAAAPHHLVDVLDPWEEVTVAWFQDRARCVIDEVLQRGHTPLLVGGSGLYFRAVVDPLDFPPTDDDVRARLETAWREDPEAGHAHLASIDPDAAAKIEPGNLRRVVRALEVIELTGRPFSSFATAWDAHESVYPGLDVVYLQPGREVLRDRIRARAAHMVAAGLLDEAWRLRALDRPLSGTARQAIGYAEAFRCLDGDLATDDLADAIGRRTWKYARRQIRWFRKDPRCVRYEAEEIVERWTA